MYVSLIVILFRNLAETSLSSSLFLNHKKSVIALNIYMAVEINLGCQKT